MSRRKRKGKTKAERFQPAMHQPVPYERGGIVRSVKPTQPPPVQYVVMPRPVYPQYRPPAPYIEVNSDYHRRRRRWYRLLALLATLLAVGGLLVWYGVNQGNIVATPPEPPIVLDEPSGPIALRATLKPERQSKLSLPIEGIIQQIHVKTGEKVEAGQLLLTLDNSRQIVGVAQSQANLEQALARLNELQSGSHNHEIAAAQAAVDAAQARLDSLVAGVRIEDENAALAQLNAAEAGLEDLLGGPDEDALIEARAELQNAEAELQRAQSAYNQVKWRNDIAMLPESQALQVATNNMERAQARFEQVNKGASAADISEARAQVKDAEAALERVRNPVSPGEIEAAKAELRQAEAELELVKVGARAQELAIAEAEVSSAKAAAIEAEVALMETQLMAPYAGVVLEISSDVGEFVNPASSLVQLGDLTTLQFETAPSFDPRLQDIEPGTSVRLVDDSAIPFSFNGTVADIRTVAGNDPDHATYSLLIQPDEMLESLEWNTTIRVEIPMVEENVASRSTNQQ